ncbi:MAG: PP2C family protein-serine/threonine phosphatase, partial [Treponemataceae bacterium]
LQPKRVLDAASATFGSFSAPARGVSSDYYDVIPVRRDRIYLVMGDVAGKGVPASLIMVMIRAILHLLVGAAKDTATILNWINRGITGKIELDHFATLQILVLDPTTGKCEYANAGHRPPIIWRKSTGIVQHIDTKSVPIGVEKSNEYTASTLTLEDGDILLMYTDGVVEAVDPAGRQYGMTGLNAILEKHNDLSSKEIANMVREDVHTFIGNARQHDDQTLLTVKVKL